MYDSVFAHWKENNISIYLFKFLMVNLFLYFGLNLTMQGLYLSFIQTSITNNKYLLIFKTSYSSESFSFWTFRKVNSTVVISFDLGMNGLSMLVNKTATVNLPRKEVIQPHLPVRLPCYDFTPVTNPALGRCLQKVISRTSGVVDSHGVTGGVYKTRERIQRSVLICVY